MPRTPRSSRASLGNNPLTRAPRGVADDWQTTEAAFQVGQSKNRKPTPASPKEAREQRLKTRRSGPDGRTMAGRMTKSRAAAHAGAPEGKAGTT